MSVVFAEAIPDLDEIQSRFPASVTVTRTSEVDLKSRQLNVWIDDERVETLLWGDSITRDLEPGPHRVRVSNTLVRKTVNFELLPGQQAFFEVVNRVGFGTLPMMLIFGVGPLYLTVRRMDS
jgi:hypothetical protein